MIVFYKKPNTLSLPYKVTKRIELRDEKNLIVHDKNGDIKFVNKDFSEYFVFIPGRNTISKELWLKIIEYNKDDMDYYSTILRIFKPKIDKETNEEIGEDEDKINLKTLNAIEMKELIDNTMDSNDLDKYLKNERKRDRIRPSIIKAIKSRKTKVVMADEALAKDQEE